jgi:hypothetical protein
MIWLRRLLNYRTVKGLEFRIKNLEDLMETCQREMGKHEKDYKTWSRLYWDSYVRHDEVCGALGYLLKDHNLR